MRDTIRAKPPESNVADMARHELERLRALVHELRRELAQYNRNETYCPSLMPSEWHLFTDENEADDAAADYPGSELIPVRFPSNYSTSEVAAWIVEVSDADGEFLGILALS